MSNRILSYQGSMADDTMETILLSTKKGEVGYKIIELKLIGEDPATVEQESVVKVYTANPGGNTTTIDFSDTTIIAAGEYVSFGNAVYYGGFKELIITNKIINQDIYITHKNPQGKACNYYLELEVLKLDESQAMVATLRDIRNNS